MSPARFLPVWFLVLGASLAAQTVDLRVTSDGSVDCSSLKSIVTDVCREGMSDRQKAIALYEFTRRLMFHYPQRSERLSARDDLDTTRLVNTYGYSFCSQQSLVLVDLWRTAGIRSICWGMPGHVTAQAEIDGRQAWFDPLIGAFVYRRDGKTLASLEDIAADPSLLTKAREENRASPSFMNCGRVLIDDAEGFCRDKPEYIKSCRKLLNDTRYIAELAGKAKPKFGPNKPLYDPTIRLRRGEKITYLWAHLDAEFNCKASVPKDMLPPHHICGLRSEKAEKANFPFWKPYITTLAGKETGRYSANGRHVYEANRRRVRMRMPHVYTSAVVTARFRGPAPDGGYRISISRDNQRTWNPVWKGREAEARATLRDQIVGMRDVWFRFEGGSGLEGCRIEAVFQHNMYARPYLVPGRNQITIHASDSTLLGRVPLEIKWSWMEEGRERAHLRKVSSVPMTYTVEVGSKELPRMRSLELSVPAEGDGR